MIIMMVSIWIGIIICSVLAAALVAHPAEAGRIINEAARFGYELPALTRQLCLNLWLWPGELAHARAYEGRHRWKESMECGDTATDSVMTSPATGAVTP